MSSVAHPFRSAFVLACVANAGLLLASDPVLQNQPSLFAAPLTTATAKQDVLMNLANRASTLEGGSSGPPTPCGYLPAPIVEKPNCDPIYWLSGAVDLRTGGASYATTDLALPTAGVPVCVGRTFNSAQGSSSKYHESDSFQGWNWFQTALPEIHVVGTTIYLVGSNIGFLEYQQVSSSSVFRGVNGAPGVFEVTAAVGTTDYELYTLWEPTGRKMQFFGASSGAPNWQLWKITNPDGKRLYAGDPTSSYTAGGSGAYTGGKVAWLIQEQGASADERKYTFSYATYGGKTRLDKVQVLPKSGGSFSATPVAEVDYDYYTALTTISANGPGTNDDDGLGDAGDLKSVTVTLPLEASTNEVRTSYYRYYTNPATDFSESQDETRGYPHGLKLVLEPEGQRRAAIAAAALSTTVDATTTANLKSYSAAFYFYASPGSDPRRVKQAFVNGECGCGSSVNGLTEFTWESNTGGSWTSGYDSDWLSRIMIEQPDGTHQMRYFDEASQPLATVVTPTLPTGTSITDMWATKVERDANGRIAAIYSPAAVSSYNHTTGALTTGNVGLVTTYTRNSTSGSPFLGLLERVEFHDNSGGGATKLSEYSYTARTEDIGSGTTTELTRPMVSQVLSAVKVVSGTYTWETVDYTYTWWNSGGTSDFYAVKGVKATLPAVAAGDNGANTAESAYSFLRPDGRVAFTQSLDGVINAVLYNVQGLPSKSVRDVNTSSSPGYDSAYEPADFDYPGTSTPLASSGTPLEYTTEMTYDAIGRATLTKLPSGRHSGVYRSVLADNRVATLAFPEVTGGGSPTAYVGPASYTVRNLAGRVELSATLGTGTVTLSSTPTSGWIDETSSDALDTLSTTLRGSSREKMRGLSTAVYDSAGIKLGESRSYFSISSSGTAGAWVGTSADYDATTYAYDNMGRVSKTVDPTGTISRSMFDALGRVSSRWIGTDDGGANWPPVGTGGSPHAAGNMTQVEAVQYDGNASRGNSHLTKRTAYVAGDAYGFGSSTDKRETLLTYDVRGNLKVLENAVQPHMVTDYDLRRRPTASAAYNAATGLSATTVAATTLTANSGGTIRLTLSKTFYDGRGQVFKTSRHKIDQADGSDDDSLETLLWRDSMGRVIKEGGDRHTKRQYDRFGRVIRQFELARDNDTAYADADDVTGDYVLTESQTLYDDINDTGNVMMSTQIARHYAYDSHAHTGELDTGYSTPDAYTLQAAVASAEVQGRIAITSFWYDSQDRPVGTVPYGTNGNSSYDRAPSGAWASMPSRSSTVLLSETLYDDFGQVKLSKSARVVSSNPLKTRSIYDQAMRRVAEIRSDTGSDSTPTTLSSPAADRDTDVYTRYTYDDGLMKTMWVDIDGDNTVDSGDQVTTYFYGVVKAGDPPAKEDVSTDGEMASPPVSAIASNRLLWKVKYPRQLPSESIAVRCVYFTYSAQGQRLTKLDQNGTTHTYTYDNGGRLITDAVTLAGGSTIDNAVLRVATAYNARGMVSTVTQYDAASGGDETDQVAYTYDGWGLLTDYQQDNDDIVTGTSGANDYGVRYEYSKASYQRTVSMVTWQRRAGLRRDYTRLRYGGGTGAGYGAAVYGWQFTYEDTSGSQALQDNNAGWVTRVYKTNDDGGSSLQLQEYGYMGDGRVVLSYTPTPNMMMRLYVPSAGDPYGPYLDRWGRVIGSEYKTGSGIVYQATPVYDEASNITSVSQYHTPYGAVYEPDSLNRLAGAKVGVVSSGAISGTVFAEEDWTAGTSGALSLSQTGNWTSYIRSKDGASELSAAGTFRDNNQYSVRDVDGTGSTALNYEVTYDKSGNLVDDDKPGGGRTETAYGFRYVYDGWNRLRKAYDGNGQSGGLVKEYRYNGLGHLIAEHADSDGDSDVDGSDQWRHNQYNERWQLLAVWEDAVDLPAEVYSHHHAGRDGDGDSSFIDQLICRERDKDNDAAPLSREERLYYVQNWRHDVVALIRADSAFTAAVVERIRYDAYGRPTSFNPADVGRSGGVIGPDGYLSNDDVILAQTTGSQQWYTDSGSTGGVGLPDGSYNSNDDVAFNAAYVDFPGDYGGGGFGVLSGSNLDNRVGYAGYRFDPALNRGGASTGKPVWHVRHRWLDSASGKWGQMDPAKYIDGPSFYAYIGSDPVESWDEMGLCSSCNPLADIMIPGQTPPFDIGPPTEIPRHPTITHPATRPPAMPRWEPGRTVPGRYIRPAVPRPAPIEIPLRPPGTCLSGAAAVTECTTTTFATSGECFIMRVCRTVGRAIKGIATAPAVFITVVLEPTPCGSNDIIHPPDWHRDPDPPGEDDCRLVGQGFCNGKTNRCSYSCNGKKPVDVHLPCDKWDKGKETCPQTLNKKMIEVISPWAPWVWN